MSRIKTYNNRRKTAERHALYKRMKRLFYRRMLNLKMTSMQLNVLEAFAEEHWPDGYTGRRFMVFERRSAQQTLEEIRHLISDKSVIIHKRELVEQSRLAPDALTG